MAITTRAQLNAAPRQRVRYLKTNSPTTVAGAWFSYFDRATDPPAGTMAVGNTTAGIVPTDLSTGYPRIDPFAAGATGYLAALSAECGAASAANANTWAVYDCLFSAGAFAFNANTTLAGQPSYASRVPDADYSNGIELWLEQVTAGTGNQNVNVTYTNQAGTAGRTTGTVATGTNIVNRMWRLPLQAGDNGIQSIQTIVGSVATAGTFNIHVMRNLFRFSQRRGGASTVDCMHGDGYGPESICMPVVYDTSAIRIIQLCGATTGQVPHDITLDIVNG